MSKELKIMNPEQVYFYISNGARPKRVDCGYNNKLVFIYDSESTQELFNQWKINHSKR